MSADLVAAVKPHLRGWIHTVTAPLALIAGAVLIWVAPSDKAKIAALIFVLTAVQLFGTSAIYHRGHWSPRVHQVLKRLDHANIFLIIAGSYTPFAALLLEEGTARTLLWIVWAGALAGMAFRVFWVHAPRWLYTPMYVALGWVAVFYFAPLAKTGGPLVMTLLTVGGVLYTLGAVVYGLRRPDPAPKWFGFHEIFHVFTVLAFLAHFSAVSLIVVGSPALA